MNAALPIITTSINLAVIVVIAITVAATRQDLRRGRLLLLTLGVSIPFLVGVGYYTNHLLPNLIGIKLDEYAFRADLMFGEPSFILGRFLGLHPHLYALAVIAYFALHGAMSLTMTVYILTSSYEEGKTMVKVFALNFLLATPFYLAFPVAGPAHAFAGFPWTLPTVNVAHVVLFYGVPNGMPSIHTSTALLILYFARRSKIGIVLASLYLALIVLATLGSGEHYIIDLFASVPYTAAVIWLGKKLAYRNRVQTLDATLEILTWQRSQQ